MKKFFTVLAVVLFTSAAFAGGYKLNNNEVDAMFASADDVTATVNVEETDLNVTHVASINNANQEQTVGGYLLRSYFCGSFAAHRGYMGNGGKKLWVYYLCIPIYGSVLNLVDFWRVVFDSSRMEEYRDNSNVRVWGQK